MNNNEPNSQDKTKCLSCENCKCREDEYLTDLQIDGINTILKRNDVECEMKVFNYHLANGISEKYTWTISKLDHEKRETKVYKCINLGSKVVMTWKLIETLKWQD